MSGVGLQRAVRGYVVVETKLPDAPKITPPLPGADSEAFITWGVAASLSAGAAADGTGLKPPGSGAPHVHTKQPKGKKKKREEKKNKQDKQAGVIALDMLDAKFETGKVYAPDDPDIWVKVQRMTSVRFRGPVPAIKTNDEGEDQIVYVPTIWKMNLALPKFPPAPKAKDE